MSRPTPLRLLLVEDSADDAALIVRELRRAEFDPIWERVDSSAGLAAALVQQAWDVIIADHNLPQFSAPAALAVMQQAGIDVPFLIVSGSIGEEQAVEIIKQGAADYLLKDRLARLASSVTQALERKRLQAEKLEADQRLRDQAHELRLAGEVQERLLPATLPVLPGLDIGGVSHPAEATGGDYYDFMQLGDDSLAMVIADVSGHGLASALLMAETHAYLRALMLTYRHFGHRRTDDIGRTVGWLNKTLAMGPAGEHFVTLLFAHLDLRRRELLYVNAGHPTGYVLDAEGKVKQMLKSTGMALGILADEAFPCGDLLTVEPGDIVLFLTDGVLEARGPENSVFGHQRALDIARVYRKDSAAHIAANLYHAVRAFCRNHPQLDDITAVVVKIGDLPSQ